MTLDAIHSYSTVVSCITVAVTQHSAQHTKSNDVSRGRLCGHVKRSSLISVGYLEIPDRTVGVRTCATSPA